MRDSTYAGDGLTVTDIVQYHYCPRKVYFLRVMDVPAGVRRKMEYGDEIHEREKRRMLERKDLYGFDKDEVSDVIQDLQVESRRLGLRGKLDVVLRLRDDDLVPVETKYTDFVSPQRHYLKQLYAYALLLEEWGGAPVKKGIIYFAQQKKSIAVDITRDDKESVMRDIAVIERMLSSEEPPRAVSPEKCSYCEVKKYCM
ncbi:MAG: CRISPR-associated protein Cas4 [Candidatus Bathyarchaeia archaeon]|jgi:CRISPR-associated exonuclease Cas4